MPTKTSACDNRHTDLNNSTRRNAEQIQQNAKRT